MKYRIIYRDGPYPYHLEQKKRIFWKFLGSSASLVGTKVLLRSHIRDPKLKSGTVLNVYDESDLVIEKLKDIL